MWAFLRAFVADYITSKVELLSPLPYDECMRRIREEVDRWPFGARPMVGSLREGRIRVRQRIGYRNSFQTALTATFTAEGRNTRIRCRFGMHPFVTIFMIYWLSMVAWFGLHALSTTGVAPINPAQNGAAAIFALMPLLMFCFGLGLMGFGRYLARDEQAFLTDLLITKLDARPA
jgi:hypothetical protein